MDSYHNPRRVRSFLLDWELYAFADSFNNDYTIKQNSEQIIGKQMALNVLRDSKALFHIISKWLTTSKFGWWLIQTQFIKHTQNNKVLSLDMWGLKTVCQMLWITSNTLHLLRNAINETNGTLKLNNSSFDSKLATNCNEAARM